MMQVVIMMTTQYTWKSANMFVCFFAKDYNCSTIIKRLLQSLVVSLLLR